MHADGFAATLGEIGAAIAAGGRAAIDAATVRPV
jgi:hypothetical protein